MSIHGYFVIGYLLIMVLLAFYFLMRVKSHADFAVAGKSLPAYVIAGTLLATSMGGGAVIGGTNSIAYNSGAWSAIIFGLGVPVGAFILYLLRNKIRASEAESIPELIEAKFGSSARVVSSIIITLAFVAIVSYQFKSFSFILNQIFGVDSDTGLLIALGLILSTAVLGGLYSVAYTDFISVCLMLVGIVVGIPYVFISMDGFSLMQQNLPAANLTIENKSFVELASPFLALLLIVISDQNNFQRFAAAKGKNELKIGTICWIAGLLILSPLIAYGSSLSRAINGDTISAGESLIVLASQSMPLVIGGCALAAITGFVLTTGNSFLLSSSVNLSSNIIARYFLKNLTPKQDLLVNRIVMLILAVIAYVMISFFPSVLSIQLYAYTMYGAAITPVLLAALLTDKISSKAAVFAMIAAAVATIIWETLKRHGITDLDSVWCAFPVAVITMFIVNMFSKK